MGNDKDLTSPIYGYMRAWFDFAFEHQGLVTGNHTAIYMWFIEQNNRMGWVKEFGAPRDQTMAAAGISSYNTYKKCFEDVVLWGFIKLVKKSKNQYQANVIALSKFDKAKYKALDKALYRHCTQQSTGTVSGTVAITIPIDLNTTKPINNKIYIRPSLNDFINYFLENGFQKEFAEHVYEYYNLSVDIHGQWFDSKNNLVKNWKQKVKANWLIEKNKNFTNQKKSDNGKQTNNGSASRTIESTAIEYFNEKWGTSEFTKPD